MPKIMIVDDDEDFAKDVGYISIGLLAGGCLNVVVLSIYKLSRRFRDKESKKEATRDIIRNVYLKTRKPLNYLHYLLTLAGTSIILYHGITFVGKDEEVGIFGWVSVGIFIFYVVTGVMIKLKIKPLWNSTRTRKILNRTHRTLILFLVVIAIHIVHILLAD